MHLPFVPPGIEDGRLTGSGSSDMKGGIAAAVEAVRALRDAVALAAGSVLLTAHDLHEAPWGDSSQLDQLIRDGHLGDAVLLPEPLRDVLPVAGRGSATWKLTIRRQGPPVHEVMRPPEEPSVIAAAAELVARLGRLDEGFRASPHPVCGPASVFIGQVHAGEIFNGYPQEAWLEGTRRWLPGTDPVAVETRVPGDAQPARRGYPDPARRPLDDDPRWLRARPSRPPGRGVPALSPGDLGPPLPPVPSRSSTTAMASAPWAASRRSPTARAVSAHRLGMGHYIDDLSASPGSTRRRPSNSASA